MTRAQKIMEKAALRQGEAILLSKPSNIFYVSGYTGEGIALLAEGLCAVVTDFRYTEQVTRQAPGFEVFETAMRRRKSWPAAVSMPSVSRRTK